MAHDTGKVQVFERVDGRIGWRKRGDTGDIIATDGTSYGSLDEAVKAASVANPGADRVEIILTVESSGDTTVPGENLLT